MVQVMSRGWTASSIKLPTSAGVMSLGGSYIGATEMSGWGSRPFVHQKTNITAKAHSGSSTMGLLRKNHIGWLPLLGCVSRPLLMETSAVGPPRMDSGLLVSISTVLLRTSAVA